MFETDASSTIFTTMDINGDGVIELLGAFPGDGFYYYYNGSVKNINLDFYPGTIKVYPANKILYLQPSGSNGTDRLYYRFDGKTLTLLCSKKGNTYRIGSETVSYSSFSSYASELVSGASEGTTGSIFSTGRSWEEFYPTRSGKATDRISWVFDKKGKLTISGTGGVMLSGADYQPGWLCYTDEIRTVVLQSGITEIWYMECPFRYMTTLYIPASLTSIDAYIFNYSTSSTYSLKDVYYAGTKAQWNRITIGDGNEALLNATIHYNSAAAASGTWKKDSKGWWYQYSDGSYPANKWAKIDGKWYYFDKSGYMQTGWVKSGGKWYYMDSSGAMQTGWVKSGGKWYYMDSSGAMQTGWVKVSGKWYYMDSSGVMQTGWQKISNRWYYLTESGVMLTGWQKISNKWYYLGTNGVMTTGWQKISGIWYYMNTSGVMQTGWLKSGGAWYYLDSTGAMVTGTKKIDGKVYTFNSNGTWVINIT